MIICTWNIEGLTPGKQEALTNHMTIHDISAAILTETWIKPHRSGPAVPPGWVRLDIVCPFIRRTANRGIGGISLLCRVELAPKIVVTCDYTNWAIFHISNIYL